MQTLYIYIEHRVYRHQHPLPSSTRVNTFINASNLRITKAKYSWAFLKQKVLKGKEEKIAMVNLIGKREKVVLFREKKILHEKFGKR